MRIISLAVTAALLAGCSAERAEWPADTVPVVLVPAAPALAVKPRECVPLEPEIATEARRTVPLEAARAGGIDALSAALMGAEARKNASLVRLTKAYEACRRGR